MIRSLLLLTSLFGLCACSQVSYYSQSVVGHSRLMLARQPVSKAIAVAEQEGNKELAEQLTTSQSIRQFATTQLSLPDNGSYQNYVPLKRDYPVWTIVAANEFSVEPKQWCYLIIGCASYRGYFKQASAMAYANDLREQGYEVSLGGTPAYSTLGWFNDPLLPSMFHHGEAVLAETIFHELAHQVLYVKGDSEFNEAFATVVGEQGAQLWLLGHRENLLADYQSRSAAYVDFVNLLRRSRKQLAMLYVQDMPADEMRKRKQIIFRQLEQNYAALKVEKWQGRAWFDGWFARPINNARLSAIATYTDRVPELRAYLVACGGDFKRYYRGLKAAAKQTPLVTPRGC